MDCTYKLSFSAPTNYTSTDSNLKIWRPELPTVCRMLLLGQLEVNRVDTGIFLHDVRLHFLFC